MRFPCFFPCVFSTILLAGMGSSFGAETKPKPVLLYSRYFNAEGEDRYLPDGNYKAFLEKLRGDFEVVVHNKPLRAQTLKGIDLILIANPSDKSAKGHVAPHHFSAQDITDVKRYLE